MNELQKTIEEYNSWKSKIGHVLDNEYETIISVIIGAYGLNTFIPTKIEQVTQQSASYGQATQNYPVLHEGIVINRNPQNGDYYLWYYKDNIFFLIERAKANQFLNIYPVSNNPLPQYNSSQKASTETEVDFVISFMDWADTLVHELKQKMATVTSDEFEVKIKEIAKLSI